MFRVLVVGRRRSSWFFFWRCWSIEVASSYTEDFFWLKRLWDDIRLRSRPVKKPILGLSQFEFPGSSKLDWLQFYWWPIIIISGAKILVNTYLYTLLGGRRLYLEEDPARHLCMMLEEDSGVSLVNAKDGKNGRVSKAIL